MSDLKVDGIIASTGTNTALTLQGKGSGTVDIGDGALSFPDADGTAGHFIKTNGSGTLSFASAGKILQYVQTQVTSNATTSTTMPDDDTIPQITEGGEFITLAITPTASDSTLVIDVTAHIVATTSNRIAISAVFVDSTANALTGGVWKSFCPTAEDWIPHSIRIALSAASTSARTYKFRAGASVGTCEMNSDNPATDFAGNIASYMSITEYGA